ncbi:MAG: YdeI/OmpD-associated family protein [Acidobacteriota bacterium]
MVPTFFTFQSEFRKWLAINHDKNSELLVGFYKVGSDKPSLTWPESVDQALCFGWIDGVRRRIDDDSYSIRFTPRKPTSIWSAINIKKVEELIKSGQMRPAGLAAFERRKESKSRIYAYENEPAKLSAEFEKLFKANKMAWAFFTTQAKSYQNVIIHRIMTAKQEKTRLSRLEQAITESEEQRRLI